MTLIVVEGPAHTGVEATSQGLAEHLHARHVALYEGPYEQLTTEGHVLAGELALQLAIGLDTDVIFERWLPSTWVIARARNEGFDQFKVMFLDHAISQTEHLGVFLRPKSFEHWLELHEPSYVPPNREMGRKLYNEYDHLYHSYIRGSQMRWVVMDPFPPIERVIRLLKRNEHDRS